MAPLKDVDRARIENIDTSREKALELAASGKAEDLRAVQALLAAPAIPLDPDREARRALALPLCSTIRRHHRAHRDPVLRVPHRPRGRCG